MRSQNETRSLIVHHLLYFTSDQRRIILQSKTPVELIGVSVPVWFDHRNTSEPAEEVFCKYTITNQPDQTMVQSTPTGYQINMPQPRISQRDEETDKIFGIISPDKTPIPDQKKLGDEAGSGWLLFKEFQMINIGEESMKILHYIEMRDIAYYWDSIFTTKDSNEEIMPFAY